jgi:hypothetical protein
VANERAQWWAISNTAIKIWVPIKGEEFLKYLSYY